MVIDEVQSRTIDFLRFPLIIGVVLIHSRYKEISVGEETLNLEVAYSIYGTLSYLISEIIARVAVPLFFFFSGFLFFSESDFTFDVYRRKLRKRFNTLVIPYLFWNIATIIFFLLGQRMLPELFSGANKLIADYSLHDWFASFWSGYKGLYPICYQFWFIRDLLIVILFSPLFFYMIKYLKQYGIYVLGILWIFDIWFVIPGFSITAIFSFTLGGWFRIYQHNFILALRPLLWYLLPIYLVFIMSSLYLRQNTYIHNISILLGGIFIVSLTSHMLEHGRLRLNKTLSESSFFIYASHAIVLALLSKLLLMVIKPHSDLLFIALYLFCPLVVVTLGFYLYQFLKRYFSNIVNLITGGR